MNKQDLIIGAKALLCVVLFIVLLGFVGRGDYEDDVICEMKNNGAYWELVEQYPDASDSQLVSIYKEEYKK